MFFDCWNECQFYRRVLILKRYCLAAKKKGSPVKTYVWAELQFTPICCNGAINRNLNNLNLVPFQLIEAKSVAPPKQKLSQEIHYCNQTIPFQDTQRNFFLDFEQFRVFKVGHSSNFLYQGFAEKYFLGIYLHSKA